MFAPLEPKQENKHRYATPKKTADSALPAISAPLHYNTSKPAQLQAVPVDEPVIQMVRKRVKGVAGNFSDHDIYYDKDDGKYYSGIIREEEKKADVLITNEENTKYTNTAGKAGRAGKTTVLVQANTPTKKVGNIQGATADTGGKMKATADVFSDGTEMTNPPKAIRLYAEGNMKHAYELAKAFGDPKKVDAFMKLDATNALVNDQLPNNPETLIKATEYDDRAGLVSRYDGVGADLDAASGHSLIEASFGGKTGDLTRAESKKSKRKYDIIQATFFWLPHSTNGENLLALKNFMLNQKCKLRDDGKIRAVLTNKSIRTGLDGKNNYRLVADRLEIDDDLKKEFNIRIIELPKKYSERLGDIDINKTGAFKHTQTKADKEVPSQNGDLIVEAALKQPPKTEPPPEPNPVAEPTQPETVPTETN